jgi:hypothetical protein
LGGEGFAGCGRRRDAESDAGYILKQTTPRYSRRIERIFAISTFSFPLARRAITLNGFKGRVKETRASSANDIETLEGGRVICQHAFS